MTYTHTQNLPNIELIDYTQDDVDQVIPIMNTDDKCIQRSHSITGIITQEQHDQTNIQNKKSNHS